MLGTINVANLGTRNIKFIGILNRDEKITKYKVEFSLAFINIFYHNLHNN